MAEAARRLAQRQLIAILQFTPLPAAKGRFEIGAV